MFLCRQFLKTLSINSYTGFDLVTGFGVEGLCIWAAIGLIKWAKVTMAQWRRSRSVLINRS